LKVQVPDALRVAFADPKDGDVGGGPLLDIFGGVAVVPAVGDFSQVERLD
jgi:hypothetical protein